LVEQGIAYECAVVSQFCPGEPPSRRSFRLRDGVMSGIALATVIVEASATSGTRVQARLALGQGRPVLLREPLVNQTWARELAAQPGVHTFRDPEQIVAALSGD
jgi:DNA processing protein